ncbi:MAG: enolase C-terminal domain-like protein, partial [Flavobacteriales bacterium]
MIKASYTHYELEFKTPVGTSRGEMSHRDSWFIFLWDDEEKNPKPGIGECAPLPGLSKDKIPSINKLLKKFQKSPEEKEKWLGSNTNKFPAVKAGIEMAYIDYEMGGNRILFPSDFTERKDYIPINGLIWMGDPEFMREQIDEKLDQGFKCIKLKIGAKNFDEELKLIEYIRERYDQNEVSIRVDANGAYNINEAIEVTEQLAKYEVHSIEQPLQ